MTTVIEENQRNEELHKRYLISKRWISDLELFNQDLNFLQKLVERCYSQLKKLEMSESLLEMKLNVLNLQTQSIEIERKVLHHLTLLKPLINNGHHNYEISLIETHNLLEREISGLLQTFKSVKQRVFKLTSERIKAVNSKNISNLLRR
jgi:hypothetical protein